MFNKKLVTMGLIAAMLMTGCAGKTGTGTQTDAAQADTAQTEATAVEAKTETEADAAQETITAELVKYESAEGWSASYDKSIIEVTEDDGTWFSYIGKADGVNRIIVKYYPGEMPDEVLYDVMADANGLPEHTRSEGYFGAGKDVWSMKTSMASGVIENATEDYIAVERNGGTLLLQVITSKQADEMTGMSISDAFSAVVDSFELKDQQPQTYSANVPGKYVAQITDQIDGQEVTAEYYVQFNEDHTGVIHMQDEIPVIWYSREGKVLSAQTGEQIYEYAVEGDMLYLTDSAAQDPEAIEFTKEAEAETSASVDYSSADNWVYFGVGDDKDIDLFLVCPTVDTLDEEFMSLENDVMKGYFAGALEMERGALKVTDVTPEEYPAVISVLPEGSYHIYDYQFFFMNLQENVKHRVELYMEQAAATEQAA